MERWAVLHCDADEAEPGREGERLNVAPDDDRGVWFDHIRCEDGGVLDLIGMVRGICRTDALVWPCRLSRRAIATRQSGSPPALARRTRSPAHGAMVAVSALAEQALATRTGSGVEAWTGVEPVHKGFEDLCAVQTFPLHARRRSGFRSGGCEAAATRRWCSVLHYQRIRPCFPVVMTG